MAEQGGACKGTKYKLRDVTALDIHAPVASVRIHHGEIGETFRERARELPRRYPIHIINFSIVITPYNNFSSSVI